MTNTDIKELKKYIKLGLMDKYHMSETAAHCAVRDSWLSEKLRYDKDFVDHDTIDYWVDFIYSELIEN